MGAYGARQVCVLVAWGVQMLKAMLKSRLKATLEFPAGGRSHPKPFWLKLTTATGPSTLSRADDGHRPEGRRPQARGAEPSGRGLGVHMVALADDGHWPSHRNGDAIRNIEHVYFKVRMAYYEMQRVRSCLT